MDEFGRHFSRLDIEDQPQLLGGREANTVHFSRLDIEDQPQPEREWVVALLHFSRLDIEDQPQHPSIGPRFLGILAA